MTSTLLALNGNNFSRFDSVINLDRLCKDYQRFYMLVIGSGGTDTALFRLV